MRELWGCEIIFVYVCSPSNIPHSMCVHSTDKGRMEKFNAAENNANVKKIYRKIRHESGRLCVPLHFVIIYASLCGLMLTHVRTESKKKKQIHCAEVPTFSVIRAEKGQSISFIYRMPTFPRLYPKERKKEYSSNAHIVWNTIQIHSIRRTVFHFFLIVFRSMYRSVGARESKCGTQHGCVHTLCRCASKSMYTLTLL